MGTVEVFIVTTIILSFSVEVPLADENDTFKLLVLHTNDMHSKFEQTNSLGGPCSMKKKGSCYGGFARLAQTVRDIKNTSKDPVLFLNAGDTYQGSVWFTVYKWRIVAHFIELLGIDAMSLGNHEFDDEVKGLVPFLQSIMIPIVAANLDATVEPSLLPYVRPSVEFNINDTTIGVIGYLTPDTEEISHLGNVVLWPEVESVAKEAARLRAKGVKILIALGHSGFRMDLEIARLVPDIDLVIGGHTNTFLYTGTPPDIEIPVGKYPKIVVQQSGRKVPVVQAYAFTKYLGYLHLTFDQEGELISYKGNPILLDHKKPEDIIVLKELDPWRANITELTKKIVGHTRVFLDGSHAMCRNVECNLGNLIADSMVHYNMEQYYGNWWTDGAIAIINGGAIRTSIFKEDEAGAITMADVMTVLPFGNPVLLVELAGKHIMEILELSASFHDPNGQNLGGGFLQFSGLHVRYNMSKPIGNRTLEAKVRCAACHTPTLEEIKPDESYFILMSDFLAGGGDGYSVIENNIISSKILRETDTEILVHYLSKRSPIIHGIEWRIQIVYGDEKHIYDGEESFGPSLVQQKNSGFIWMSQYTMYCSIFIFLEIFLL